MATLTDQDIEKIAHLARLAIPAADIPVHAQNLSNILQLVEQINKAPTENIEPSAHPLDGFQQLREDKVREIDNRELLQSMAPHTDAGLYLVPRYV